MLAFYNSLQPPPPPPPYESVAVRGTSGKLNLTLVGIFLHSIQFFLIEFAGKTKLYVLSLRHLVYGVTPSTHFCLPTRVLHFFPTGYKIRYDDFCIAPTGKTLREVELTSVEYSLIRGFTVLCTYVVGNVCFYVFRVYVRIKQRLFSSKIVKYLPM
jgi:hypothetical protein